uniref:CCHC-type domain-containing protein n=1 Tax=Cannabis sativa TaxID=3483 RepID=A0A803NT26_CANSA
MGNAKFDIEKFDGKNDFSLWRVKMRALLVQQGIQDAILGDDKIRDKTDAEKSELMEKAHSALILSLGDKVLREVSKETTTAGLWKKLESLYMTKSLANRLFLKQKLYSFKMQPGKSVEDHMDYFNKIILDLENCDIKIESEDQAIIVLNSLPSDEYENFVDTMMFGRDSLTLEEIHSALMSKELKRKSEKEDNAGEGLLIARGRIEGRYNGNQHQNHSTKGKSNSKFKKRCFICHKTSHLKRDCPELNKKPAGGSKKYGNADLVLGGYTNDDGYEIGGGTVKLGDNRSCTIKGIGTVKIQLAGGSIRELHQVEGGVLKVTQGERAIMKGLPRNFTGATLLTYLINRCPSSAIGFKTPVEARTGHPGDYGKLRTLGVLHMLTSSKTSWNQGQGSVFSLGIQRE